MFFRKRSNIERAGTKLLLAARERIEDVNTKHALAVAGLLLTTVATFGFRKMLMR